MIAQSFDDLHHEATLTALASGIIPADGADEGASAVAAGPRLAARLADGPNADLYHRGIVAAAEISRERFSRPVIQLSAEQIHDLLAVLRETIPAFFKQLRADVSAMYLSDPRVWQRIGFPGPSADKGGYPEFDQPPSSG